MRIVRLVRRAAALTEFVAAAPAVYLGLVTGAAWWATATGRGRPRPSATSTHLAVLVPAHDEAAMIAETVAALRSMDQERTRVSVHVVADHCTDDTASIARQAGADVLERRGGQRGKGPALHWAVGQLRDGPDRPDAYVVVDADTLVDREFADRIADVLAAGSPVVQGQYRVRDPDSSPAAALRALALVLRHHVRPLGRMALGAGSGLFGNGMAFRSDVLEQREWPDHLTEDVALALDLALEGVAIGYAPAAIVEAVMPPTLADSVSQHERWERGRIDLAQRYVPRLLRAAGTSSGRRRRLLVDAAADVLVPPLSVVAAATTMAVALGFGRDAASRRWRPGRRLLPLAALAGHVLSGVALGGSPMTTARAMVHAPAMVAWKLRIWARSARSSGETEWVRTPRFAGQERSA